VSAGFCFCENQLFYFVKNERRNLGRNSFCERKTGPGLIWTPPFAVFVARSAHYRYFYFPRVDATKLWVPITVILTLPPDRATSLSSPVLCYREAKPQPPHSSRPQGSHHLIPLDFISYPMALACLPLSTMSRVSMSGRQNDALFEFENCMCQSSPTTHVPPHPPSRITVKKKFLLANKHITKSVHAALRVLHLLIVPSGLIPPLVSEWRN